MRGFWQFLTDCGLFAAFGAVVTAATWAGLWFSRD